MSVDRAAAIMGHTVRHVRRLCEQGRLAARMVDGHWQIDPACDHRLRAASQMTVPAAPAGSLLAGMSRTKREGLSARYELLQQFLSAREACPADQSLTQWTAGWVEMSNARRAAADRVSVSTFMRWKKEFDAGGVEALVDGRRYCGTPTECAAAWTVFLDMYLSQNNPKVPRLWEQVAALSQQNGWNWISLSTCQRWVAHKADPKLLAYGRDPKKFRDRCIPYINRDWTKIPAMGCWVADHHECDVMLPHKVWSDKKMRHVWAWHRPWLTMFLDARTWRPTCWTIRFESPDGNVVMATLVRGITAHGSPDVVYLDNGKDFRMRKFSGGRPKKIEGTIVAEQRVKPLLETLGIRSTFAIPYNAKAKVIEPWFRLFGEWFSKTWETYIGNRPERRPESFKKLHGRAEEFAQKGYTLEAFNRAFNQWLTGDYCLRQSPSNACEGLSVERAFMGLRAPGFVPCRPAAQDLAVLLMPSESVKVGQDGIFVRAFSAYYYDSRDGDQFAALESRRCASGRDIQRHIRYSYDPSDSSRIFVCDAVTEKFLCFATPSPCNSQHPLASILGTKADQDKLSDGIEAAQHLGKLTVQQSTALHHYANVLLNGRRLGAEQLHLLDKDPLPKAPPPILQLTQVSHVAQQASVHKEQAAIKTVASSQRQSMLQTFFNVKKAVPKEGTTDQPAVGFSALDMLAQHRNQDVSHSDGTNQPATDGVTVTPCRTPQDRQQ